MDVDFYADPSCAWSWAAYRWLDEVASRRQLRPIYRPFSLSLRDGTERLPPLVASVRQAAHRALRVAAGIADDGARWAFAGAVGAALYRDAAERRATLCDVEEALSRVGLDRQLARAADEPDIDSVIARSMDGLATLLPRPAGDPQRIPIVVVGPPGHQVAFHGPLLDPAPTGSRAVQLWDALEAVVEVPGLYEISRPRPAAHSLVRALSAGGHR